MLKFSDSFCAFEEDLKQFLNSNRLLRLLQRLS